MRAPSLPLVSAAALIGRSLMRLERADLSFEPTRLLVAEGLDSIATFNEADINPERTWRIEAGIPKAGPELNEEIVPPEANLEEKAFSLTKGCYPGQEVVARMDTYGNVRRHLVGLTLKDSTVPPKGSKLFSGDREVGWISSAVHSPQLNKAIALGFPLRDFSKPGTDLTVEFGDGKHPATVQPLPFYAKP